jgi:hypothetical protein
VRPLVPSPAWTLVTPTASAPNLGAGRTRRPRDSHLSHAGLRPPRFPPSRSASRSTHLGWGTRRHSLVGLGTPRSRNADKLPDHLADVHDVFHVSQLKKCLRVPEEQLPMEDLSVQDDLTYAEYPIKILDTLTHVTRIKVIKMCKVQWSHHGEDEATWEREEELRIDYPHLFPRSSKISRTRLFLRGV